MATLVVAAVLPIVLSGAVAVHLLFDRQRSLIEAELLSSAEMLLAALEQELESQVAMLLGMTRSPALDKGDLRLFHEDMRRLQQPNSSRPGRGSVFSITVPVAA